MQKKENLLKGYFYTLEALIGITIILISIVMIFNISQVPASSGTSLVKRQGFEALEFLEQNDELRFLAFSGNKVQLKNRLRELLPATVSLELDICTSSCRGAVPASKSVVSIDYYLSGYQNTFSPKKIKLWMWGSF